MDLEMQKKNGKGLVVVIVLLVLLVLSLGGYLVYDKLLSKESIGTDQANKNSSVKGENNAQNEQASDAQSIDINNENIKALFESSYDHMSYGIDETIFKNTHLSVNDMNDSYKIRLAYSRFSGKIEQDLSSGGDYTYSIKEEDVRAAYEQIFGPNTFQRPASINLGCGDYTYNSQTKKYVNNKSGCGGASAFSAEQDIIRATKYKDRIEITSAVCFVSGADNALFKDYEKREKIRDLTESDLTNTVDNPASTRIKQYIQQDKDKLTQYTYTYKLGSDGFYYYIGVEKTK